MTSEQACHEQHYCDCCVLLSHFNNILTLSPIGLVCYGNKSIFSWEKAHRCVNRVFAAAPGSRFGNQNHSPYRYNIDPTSRPGNLHQIFLVHALPQIDEAGVVA